MVAKFLFFVTLQLLYVFSDRHEGLISNRLTFSPGLQTGGPIMAILSSGESPERLLAYYIQSNGKGWGLAVSEDALAWEEKAIDLLPEAYKGDVIESGLISNFTHLVVYCSRWNVGVICIGGVTDYLLRGYVLLGQVRGKNPFLFKLEGSVYLGILDEYQEIQFFNLTSQSNGSFDIVPLNSSSSVKKLSGTAPRIFCFKSTATKCILMNTAENLGYNMKIYYSNSVVGMFDIQDRQLRFMQYADTSPSTFDYGPSSNFFRLVEFQGNVLAIGWSGYPGIDFGGRSSLMGFTLPRIVTFHYYCIKQVPLPVSKYILETKFFNSSDTVLKRAGYHAKLPDNRAYMIDLYFDDGSHLQDAQYAIDFMTKDGSKGTLKLYPHTSQYGREIYLDFRNAQQDAYALSYIPICKKSPFKGTLQIFIDYATVSMFFEDGHYTITQAYNFNGSGQIIHVTIKPSGNADLVLLKNSSISSIRNINSVNAPAVNKRRSWPRFDEKFLHGLSLQILCRNRLKSENDKEQQPAIPLENTGKIVIGQSYELRLVNNVFNVLNSRIIYGEPSRIVKWQSNELILNSPSPKPRQSSIPNVTLSEPARSLPYYLRTLNSRGFQSRLPIRKFGGSLRYRQQSHEPRTNSASVLPQQPRIATVIPNKSTNDSDSSRIPEETIVNENPDELGTVRWPPDPYRVDNEPPMIQNGTCNGTACISKSLIKPLLLLLAACFIF